MTRRRTGHGSNIDHTARKVESKQITDKCNHMWRLKIKFDAAAKRYPPPREIY